jgi:hypothetical protein
MPVLDEDAKVISQWLPENSWLRAYVEHCKAETDAPAIYHYGVGLGVLAATCPTNYAFFNGSPIHANHYVLCVGRSGFERKTTSTGKGTKILQEAAPQLFGNPPATQEGLFDALAVSPKQLIEFDEFGSFLSSTKKGYAETLKPFLTQAWDCKLLGRGRAKNKENLGRSSSIEKPRLSFAAACAFTMLEENCLVSDWSSGFFGRWLMFVGVQEHVYTRPVQDTAFYTMSDGTTKTRRQVLVEMLKERAALAQTYDQLGGPPLGQPVGWEPKAGAMWDSWQHGLSKRPAIGGKIEGVAARAPAIALKVMLTLAWDYGPPISDPGKDFLWTEDILIPALLIIERYFKSLEDVGRELAETPIARLRKRVYNAVAESPSGLAGLGDITHRLKMTQREVKEVIATLLDENSICCEMTIGGKPIYRLAGLHHVA